MNLKSKKVAQYNIEGNIVNQYSSVKEAMRKTSLSRFSIESCIRGKTDCTTKGIWRIFDDVPAASIDVTGLRLAKYKPVYQYTMYSKLVKKWNTVAEVQNALGASPGDIIQAIEVGCSRLGFYWSFDENHTVVPTKSGRQPGGPQVPVALYDPVGNLIKSFKSITSASIRLGLKKSIIQENLDGKRDQTALGVWKYYEPPETEKPQEDKRLSPRNRSNRIFTREDVIKIQSYYNSYVQDTAARNRDRPTAERILLLPFREWLDEAYPMRKKSPKS